MNGLNEQQSESEDNDEDYEEEISYEERLNRRLKQIKIMKPIKHLDLSEVILKLYLIFIYWFDLILLNINYLF